MKQVRYLKQVTEPERLAGEAGQVRVLDDAYAAHLVQERCVVLEPEPEVQAPAPDADAPGSEPQTEPAPKPEQVVVKRRK